MIAPVNFAMELNPFFATHISVCGLNEHACMTSCIISTKSIYGNA